MTEPRPSSNEDDRLHRMLLAYVRQEFEAPVGAILGYAEIMLEDAERHYARAIVAQHDGNKTEAARALGIGRNTLARLLKDQV